MRGGMSVSNELTKGLSWSGVLGSECGTLDNVIEDSVVGDERMDDSLLCGVMVLVRECETKRPCTRGWFFQASVAD
jgi:hypothetical protein